MTDPTSRQSLPVAFLGSGAFGLPTLAALRDRHDVRLVISQPDRPAGRKQRLTPTPIAEAALAAGLRVERPESVNDDEAIALLESVDPAALVVVAYGQKLGPRVLADRFAINLHSSLLPLYRGAAPINRAMMDDRPETGVSIITLADRMDAGSILGEQATPIDPNETAGELHDRLAALGAPVVLRVLDAWADGTLEPREQDESLATRAPKLTKAEGTVSFEGPASAVRARIHGLTPWPGCTVRLDDRPVKLLRVRAVESPDDSPPGTLTPDGVVRCGDGAVELLEVQPAGGKPMPFEAFARGQRLEGRRRLEPA